MTPTELRLFIRDMTLVAEHELSDALLNRFLLEGHTKVCKRRNWAWLLQDIETFVPGTGTFILANLNQAPIQAIADLAPTERLHTPLTQITRTQYTFMTRGRGIGNYPKVYWVENGNLYFDPAPSAGEEFAISYYAVVPWDIDADEEMPQVPEDSHTSTVGNYAIHRIWERQEDLDKSDAYLGRYEVAVAELIEIENRFNADGPKIMGEIAGIRGRNNMPWLDGIS